MVNERPGSGSDRKAERKERINEVMVDKRIEWRKVLFVPFHIPQDPSAAHVEDIAASTADDDLRSSI